MLKNYVKIAWRNITKRKFYSALNIIGLTTGILFTLLIGSYVWNELQVNKRLRHAGNQYFLRSEWRDPNQGQDLTTTAPLAKRLKQDYPGLVANYYRWDGITSNVSKGDRHFRENIQLGDSTLLNMYGFGLLHGDAATALVNPFSTVITKDIAIKYFGNTDVVGKTLSIQSFSGAEHDFLITGVLKDIPENSVTQLNDDNHNTFFIPTNTYTYFGRADFEAWSNIYAPSYIELKEGASLASLQKAIDYLIQQNAPSGIKENLRVHPVLLTDYYLQKNNSLVKRMLYALSFVGLFILLMAVVNFINISISSSSSRMKEIGMRKVLGGVRRQIILQFLTESLILVTLATAVALAFYPMAQPFFGNLVGKQIPELLEFPPYFLAIPLVAILVVGVLAGLYPAVVLSSLKSIDSLKGKLKTVKENVLLRKSLAGFQFCIAGIVMIAAFVVSQQVTYFFSGGLGYNKEYVVSAQLPRDWTPAGVRKMETIRNEFAAMPEVATATLSYEIPNGKNGGTPPVYKPGMDSTQAVPMQSLVTDENYLAAYQIPLKAGSFFDNGAGYDSSNIILNQKAAEALGWKTPEEAVGRQVRIPSSPLVYTVRGVTGDFHFASMQQKIQPMIFFNIRLANVYRFLSVKMKPGNTGRAIAALERKWATLLPASSFEYNFMDDSLRQIYRTELQLKKASYTATVLSLVIVLLGVIGLVSLSIQKKTKEIGIRKVLGASVASIIGLFLKEFLVIIVIAGLIACPLAWVLMNGWLNDYAYRIALTPQPFLMTMLGLGFVTVLLICVQTLKAGTANPVKSLRAD
jgi:putative ABC transport system permease protein